MIELHDYLINEGFDKQKGDALRKYLFDDFYIEIKPGNDNWQSTGDLYFYLYSKGFSQLMSYLFDYEKSIFSSYKPRKLRKDQEGCLGMVMMFLELNNDVQNSTLESANIIFTVKQFIHKFNDVNTPKDLFNLIYFDELSGFIALIEGVWVYLYLCIKIGVPADIALSKSAEPELEPNTIQWNLKKPLDQKLVDYFYSGYEEVNRRS